MCKKINCPKCGKERRFYISKEVKFLKYKKRIVVAYQNYIRCNKCNSIIRDEEISKENFFELKREYLKQTKSGVV